MSKEVNFAYEVDRDDVDYSRSTVENIIPSAAIFQAQKRLLVN